MAKPSKAHCERCQSRVAAGEAFCRRCGTPTRWATHEERTSWEVTQWRTATKPQHVIRAPSGASRRGWLGRSRHKEAPALAVVSARSKPVERQPIMASPGPAMPEPAVAAQGASAAKATITEASPDLVVTVEPEPDLVVIVEPEPDLVVTVEPEQTEAPVEEVPEPPPPHNEITLEVVTLEEVALERAAEDVALTARLAPSALDDQPIRDGEATMLAMRILNARVAELDAKVRKLQRKVSRRRRFRDD